VRYEKPQDGKMKVPSGTDGDDFTISSDNTGGYIVTAWKKLG
jgi:hypothetical protein